MILKNPVRAVLHPKEPISDYDCIIYPSIAARHAADNIAIKPSSVNRLRAVNLEDVIVATTDYGNTIIYENEYPEKIALPIGRQVLRTSNNIDKKKIIWNDD